MRKNKVNIKNCGKEEFKSKASITNEI